MSALVQIGLAVLSCVSLVILLVVAAWLGSKLRWK